MKTVTYLTCHYGENSNTAKSIVSIWDDARMDIDFDEEIMCCLYWDDDRLVPTKKWGKVEVTMPEWLSSDEYLRDYVGWSYAWGRGVDKAWPESWQRSIKNMPDRAERVAIIELLAQKNFRSAFRKSLRDGIVAWLETSPEDRKYAYPLSSKQIGYIVTHRHKNWANTRIPC